MQDDELKNLSGAQIPEREPSVYLSKYFVEKEKRIKGNLEGVRSFIEDMNKVFADKDIKKT